jgi:dissimilatory sulfite reductase (desulfoviridin) alpha/beta subunit
VCDTGTLTQGEKGYRVQLGGKLGRRPRLARELPGIYNEDQVLEIIQWCLDFYKANSKTGERFAELFAGADYDRLVRDLSKEVG